MTTPESVTRAVAKMWPWSHWGACVFCGMMSTFPSPNAAPDYAATVLMRHDIHAESCPWALARAWVLENPK